MNEKTGNNRTEGQTDGARKGRGAHPVLFYGTMIFVAFVGGILIFNFLILPLLVGRGDIAIVPEIKGMPVSPAEDACRERGLNMMVTGERASTEYPAGTVMEQDPDSGESLKGNRTVKVILSSGPRTELVPALADESLRQAELLLEASGLVKGRIVRVFTH
ncbi:MAG TPA: PASTA domain-containing protein, partial [Candidatus Krumholzibacterium sp.]|nr:PASTA domain-containing protein [Candidatus Krumholzibacterium sp.]